MRLYELKNVPAKEPLPNGGFLVYHNGKPYSYLDLNGIEHIPDEIDKDGQLLWKNKNKKLHSFGDQPAVVAIGFLEWMKNGVNHREEDKPAVMWADGKHWFFKNGNRYFPKKINETIKNLPKKLYHATYQPYIESILLHGLDPSKGKKNWTDSKSVIYLANSPSVAESYAETVEAEFVPDEYLYQIRILEIDTSKLNKKLFFADRNVIGGHDDTCEYHGIIPPNAIKIIGMETNENI